MATILAMQAKKRRAKKLGFPALLQPPEINPGGITRLKYDMRRHWPSA
jgi:hypothetical protein